jgi:hypothetical protein
MWAGCTRARTSTSACGDNAWSTDSQVRSLWRAWRRAAPISHSFGCDLTLGRKNASVLSTHQGHERRSRALAGSLGGRAPTAGRGTPTLAPIATVEPDQPAFTGDQPPAARTWPGDPASRVTRRGSEPTLPERTNAVATQRSQGRGREAMRVCTARKPLAERSAARRIGLVRRAVHVRARSRPRRAEAVRRGKRSTTLERATCETRCAPLPTVH